MNLWKNYWLRKKGYKKMGLYNNIKWTISLFQIYTSLVTNGARD
jgi:hypothetical protein